MYYDEINKCIYLDTVFPRFSVSARVSAPARFSAPIRLQILISALVRVSAPPSDKHSLQISLDFDQKDGELELFLNELTSKSLGLFFFIEYSVKYTWMLYKKWSVLKNSQ